MFQLSEYIQQAEDLLIASLKLSKKEKYNVTRIDGFRINITKIRRSNTNVYHPMTGEELMMLEKLYGEKKTYKEIMKIMKISKSKVARNMQKIFNYKWKPSEKLIKKHENTIVRLRKQGCSYVQIREKLHVTSTLISIILGKNNMLGQYRKN